MNEYPRIPIIEPKEALQMISTASQTVAQKLLASSLVTQSRSFVDDKNFQVLDVTHFLNARINTKLLQAIGEELALIVSSFEPNIIFTTSGNISSLSIALNIPQRPDVIYAQDSMHLTEGMRVIICDDFLDTGKSTLDLLQKIHDANCVPIGFCYVLEKPFSGRQVLLEAGFTDNQIVSLVTIDSMRPGKLKLNGYDSWFSLLRE